jgi:MFS family permease
MVQKKKAGLISRYLKIRTKRNVLAIIIITITIYLSWLFAFPLFGPIINNYFNSILALSIEKGKWILLFLASMIASNLTIGLILNKTSRRIQYILGSAIILSALTFAFWITSIDIYLSSILIGVVAGISPVAWGAYFAKNVTPEERGRVAGIAIGLVMPIAQLFLILDSFEFSSTENYLTIIGIWILATILILAFRKKDDIEKEKMKKAKGHPPKQIILYAIPIFLFYLVSGILMSIVFPTILVNIDSSIFYVIWSISVLIGSIIGGIQLDIRGRKFPTMVGLAITGVSIALLAILDINISYLFIIPLGIGYSFVLVLSYIIWADLAPENSRGVIYGLGFALINTAQMIGLILAGTHFGSASSAQIDSVLLFAAIALFICIPPLILADESLPQSLIEKRQLMEYLDGVKDRFVKKKDKK